ncbi:MAG: hypothetical protein HYS13_15475 [Planctomycetia bacterium]|nr:hypothetical protein [Planctomycetia bacterium]
MQDKLLGYLLGALEGEETAFVEQALTSDGETRRQLDVWRLALVPLQSLPRQVDAPAGLTRRTCQRIRDTRRPAGD